jgi:predicted alpha/beta hydrolase
VISSRIVTARDGWPLSVQVHPAEGPRRGVLLLLHAMMADARSLDRPRGEGFASTLAQAGWEVWRADLRGHGGSGPSPKQGGRWSYDDIVRSDIPALVEQARAGGGELVVVGHSLGGHAAVAAATEGTPIERLVLLSTNVWLRSCEPSRRRVLRKALSMAAFQASSWPLGRFPTRRIGMGPADESLPYVQDLCGFWWRGRWAARDGADWLAGMARYRGEVLAVAGGGDHLLGHPSATARWLSAFSSASLTFWIAERGQFGLSYDPGHLEIACDQRCRPLWNHIAVWLARSQA